LLTTHLLEEADQLCQHLAFIVGGRLVAGGMPRDLKLSHGKRTMVLKLADPQDADRWTETTPSMDDPRDQARLVERMVQCNVRSIHSKEATLEKVFIEVAGIRPA
jgi:ABC-2 type transport system ATP-binding protein